jgi:hypothetical protein
VFENRVLRRIFGLKRDHVTGDWRKLHNEELHNLYSSPTSALDESEQLASRISCLEIQKFVAEMREHLIDSKEF